jgi:hypothetical protein
MDRQSPDDFLARHGEFVEPAKLEALNRQAEKFAREKANGESHPQPEPASIAPVRAKNGESAPRGIPNISGIDPSVGFVGDPPEHVPGPKPAGLAQSEPLPLVPPMPAARRYPVEALGDVLGPAARAISAKVQCPEAMAAQSVLSVASLAAQRLADIRHPMGQTRPLAFPRSAARAPRTLNGRFSEMTTISTQGLIPEQELIKWPLAVEVGGVVHQGALQHQERDDPRHLRLLVQGDPIGWHGERPEGIG